MCFTKLVINQKKRKKRLDPFSEINCLFFLEKDSQIVPRKNKFYLLSSKNNSHITLYYT